MGARLTRLSGDDAKVSRGGFLRRAGALGLAIAGVGDLVVAPLASARSSDQAVLAGGRLRLYDSLADVPPTCRAVATCNPCGGCCNNGQPCKPTGVAYCFYCTGTPCQAAGTACYDRPPKTFYICCN